MPVVADSSQPLVEVAVPVAPYVPLWRLSVHQYHEMVRHGILAEDDEVELLDGLLVSKMTKSSAHSVARWLTQNSLAKVVPEGWYVDSQDGITLAASEPEPDVTVIRGQKRDYLENHPLAADLALVVEVSDSSLVPRTLVVWGTTEVSARSSFLEEILRTRAGRTLAA
jgi:Uma2 family endonuclease